LSKTTHHSQSALFAAAASLLIAALLWISSACPGKAQAQGFDLDVWRDPQVEIAVPTGWNRIEASWVAERMLIATPASVDPQAILSSSGLDVDAAIHVKIDALDPVLQQMPLEEIAEAMIHEVSERLKGEGLEFRVLGRGESTVGGTKGVIVSTRQGSMISHALLTRTDGYLFEVALTYEASEADRYQMLVQPVLGSVRFKEGTVQVPTEERTTLLARLRVPRGWHEYTEEGAVPQVVISREQLAQRGDRYHAGFSILKIADYRHVFNLSPQASLDEVYAAWLEAYVRGMADSAYRLLQAGLLAHATGPSFLIEASFQDPLSGRYVQLFNLVTALGDDFYVAVYEAPVEEFYQLRQAYLDSISTIRWR